jgi:hypothetical protein
MRATIDTKPFLRLPTTEEFFLFPDSNPGTIPLDPTNQQHLRSMSPFVLAIDPPSIGNYVKSTTARPFRSRLPTSPNMANAIDYQTLKFSPKISTYAKEPIRGTRVEGQQRREEAGMVDRDQLVSMAYQHRVLSATPPIVFLINPKEMGFTYGSKQSYTDTSRYGFVFYRWGEELTEISINCTIGSFISGRANREVPDIHGNLSGISGLQFASRRDSAGWRQLMNILASYRNGAALADTIGRSRAYHDVGTHSIYYDGQRWQGRIKGLNFTIGEENQNGNIDFDMTFEVYRHYEQDFEAKSQLFQMFAPNSKG